MNKLAFIVLCFVTSNYGQNIASRARILSPGPYFQQVIQETMYELERREWCSLTLTDFSQTLNELTHTNLHVTGDVQYSNGFLVSIEKIDVTNITPLVLHRVVNGTTITTATVRGNVQFRDARVGYDAVANITNEDRQRVYTGIFTHSEIGMQFSIHRNMNTQEMDVSTMQLTTSGGSGVRMVYMPEDEISEILSLRFVASSSVSNVGRWAREVIVPIILDIASNKVEFPKICFNC